MKTTLMILPLIVKMAVFIDIRTLAVLATPLCIRLDKFTEFCDECKQAQNQFHARNSSNKKKAESLWRKREMNT